ncbi:MAG: CDP-alcohol phosphatidyltransferase family protein [Nitrospirae bacterium]|nr:CDP-alcohol phosphatidyltransferase family protein [Nitrospirota bacterium]
MANLNVPNTLTLLRIFTIPVIVSMLVNGRHKTALWLFVFASVTDLLDGLIARLAKQQTRLGQFLDPAADKLMLVTSFVTFAYYGWVPVWLTVSILLRDLTVVVAWVAFYIVHRFVLIRSSLLGKAAIAMQMVLCALVLLRLNYGDMAPAPDAFVWATLAFTIVSALHYLYMGLSYRRE